MVFKVILPEKISLNKIYAGVHWGKRQRIAQDFHKEFLDKRHLKVKNYPVVIAYDFYFRRNALDSLNCAFMAKMLEDAMVVAGILGGDSPDYVKGSLLRSIKSRKYFEEAVVLIKIYDSDNEAANSANTPEPSQ